MKITTSNMTEGLTYPLPDKLKNLFYWQNTQFSIPLISPGFANGVTTILTTAGRE